MKRRLDREEEMMGVGSLPASTGSQGGDPTDVQESDGRETVARRMDTEIDKASLHATGIAGYAVEAARDERAEAEAAVESVVEEIAGKGASSRPRGTPRGQAPCLIRNATRGAEGDDGAAGGADVEVAELLRREEAQAQEAEAQGAEGEKAATAGSGEEQAEEAEAGEEGGAPADAEVLEKAEEEGVPEEVAAAEMEHDAATAATAAGARSYTVRMYSDETCLGAEVHRFSLDPERCQDGRKLERKVRRRAPPHPPPC